MRRLLWLLQFLLTVLVTLPVAFIPYKASLKFGELLGAALFFSWRGRRRIAIGNLESAVSRGSIAVDSAPKAIIKKNFINLGKSLVEIVKIYYGLGGRIFKGVELEGLENFKRAHAKGKGVIFITGHCGNWELVGIVLSLRLTKIAGVARPLNNPYLNRLVEKTRAKYGNRVIYKKGALKELLLSLKRNEVVGILMDQSVVASEGVITEFLGKKDHTMKTPAIVAMKTGSAVLPVFIRRVNGGHRLEIGGEIELDRSADGDADVLNNTKKFSGYIEEYIRRNPSEWLWMHRRWKRIKEGP